MRGSLRPTPTPSVRGRFGRPAISTSRCTSTGKISLHGEEIPIDCYSVHDRSWGPRPDGPDPSLTRNCLPGALGRSNPPLRAKIPAFGGLCVRYPGLQRRPSWRLRIPGYATTGRPPTSWMRLPVARWTVRSPRGRVPHNRAGTLHSLLAAHSPRRHRRHRARTGCRRRAGRPPRHGGCRRAPGCIKWTWTGGCSGWGEDQTYAPTNWLEALDARR